MSFVMVLDEGEAVFVGGGAYAGDAPRGASVSLAWSLRIYHEAHTGAPFIHVSFGVLKAGISCDQAFHKA